jgi:hypothetical protein
MRSNGALILNGRDLLPTFGSSQKLEKNFPFFILRTSFAKVLMMRKKLAYAVIF